tara:strand:+ start:899 stop:1183 length:285 start_codon:yes stop_codon:yes gene_type:complete
MCLNCYINLIGETMYTIITRNECKYCDRAKALLDLDTIKYVEVNIELTANKWVLSLMKSSNLKSVPQVFAHDGNYVGGFRELESVLGHANRGEY